jgi:hypothetical protein
MSRSDGRAEQQRRITKIQRLEHGKDEGRVRCRTRCRRKQAPVRRRAPRRARNSTRVRLPLSSLFTHPRTRAVVVSVVRLKTIGGHTPPTIAAQLARVPSPRTVHTRHLRFSALTRRMYSHRRVGSGTRLHEIIGSACLHTRGGPKLRSWRCTQAGSLVARHSPRHLDADSAKAHAQPSYW